MIKENHTDEVYMHRCIQLALNGRLTTPPNPMVGAVIVARDIIIGEGYHIRSGEGHAEVNAFASVRPEHLSLLPEATIYVSLEPCSHYGKTPPCADLIVQKQVRRAVIGCLDPFPAVRGRGVRRLQNAGIEVTVGVCQAACEALNKVFFTFHRFHRPFVTLKWAQTADKFIAKFDEEGQPQSTQISTSYTQMLCHKLRSERQAILVGRHTFVVDNPSLTVRYWVGANPVRVLLSHHSDVADATFRLFNSQARTLMMSGNLPDILSQLYEQGIQSLLVEGGCQVLQQFIDSGLWDEAFVEQGKCLVRKGIPAPCVPLSDGIVTDDFCFFGSTLTHVCHDVVS